MKAILIAAYKMMGLLLTNQRSAARGVCAGQRWQDRARAALLFGVMKHLVGCGHIGNVAARSNSCLKCLLLVIIIVPTLKLCIDRKTLTSL